MSDTANRIVQKLWSYCHVLGEAAGATKRNGRPARRKAGKT
mgnify:CR=1 FL=1